MERGDLGTVEGRSLLVVLEGVLCVPSWEGRVRRHLTDEETWGWSIVGVQTLNRYAFSSVPVEVVTFLGQPVADRAAAWLNRYDVTVSSVEPVDIDTFCRSIQWRHGRLMSVVDSDPNRLARYGMLGYQTTLGGGF